MIEPQHELKFVGECKILLNPRRKKNGPAFDVGLVLWSLSIARSVHCFYFVLFFWFVCQIPALYAWRYAPPPPTPNRRTGFPRGATNDSFPDLTRFTHYLNNIGVVRILFACYHC